MKILFKSKAFFAKKMLVLKEQFSQKAQKYLNKERIKQSEIFKYKDKILHYIIISFPCFILYALFYISFIFLWILIFVLLFLIFILLLFLDLVNFLKKITKQIIGF